MSGLQPSPGGVRYRVATAVLSAVTFILVLWTIGGRAYVHHRWCHDHHSRLSGCRRRNCGARDSMVFIAQPADSKGIWGRAPLILIKEIKSKKSKGLRA